MSVQTDNTGALSGIRVLDLSRILAGPWATQMLADLGADVIKIERPQGGDDTRTWGPPFVEGANGEREASYFLAANRGKKSVCIDLADERGATVVRELARHCDVVIENFKVGGLARYGLDYASLSAIRPALVYCSLSGFGQDGPYAERPGYDFLVQGMSGLMSITGEPGGSPMKVGVALADVISGLYACNGILAALRHRERTGEGQHVDIALLDSMIAALANQSQSHLVTGRDPKRLGNAHPSIVPYDTFRAKDGDFIIAVGNDGQFRRLCEVVGAAALGTDPRFATNAARVKNRDELTRLLQEQLAREPARVWIDALEKVDVPAGPINTLSTIFADPQVVHRQLRRELPHPTLGAVPSVANPIRLSRTPARYDRAPPVLGADTRAVLHALLGYPDSKLDELERAGVIGSR